MLCSTKTTPRKGLRSMNPSGETGRAAACRWWCPSASLVGSEGRKTWFFSSPRLRSGVIPVSSPPPQNETSRGDAMLCAPLSRASYEHALLCAARSVDFIIPLNYRPRQEPPSSPAWKPPRTLPAPPPRRRVAEAPLCCRARRGEPLEPRSPARVGGPSARPPSRRNKVYDDDVSRTVWPMSKLLYCFRFTEGGRSLRSDHSTRKPLHEVAALKGNRRLARVGQTRSRKRKRR